MSMARSTPAQKPRGPASTICWSALVGGWVAMTRSIMPAVYPRRSRPDTPSAPEHGHAHDALVGIDAEIRLLGVGVRPVVEAIARADGDAVGHHVREARARLEHEGV